MTTWQPCLWVWMMTCAQWQCFFSRFWVSKLHHKILQWHPKFWKRRYGFALYWSKTIWDKHVFLNLAIATHSCNVTGRQFSGTKVGSENCKFGICALSCASPCFGLLLSCSRFVQYGVWNRESTLMQLWKCFNVSPLRSACLAMHQTTMKTKGQRLQRTCKTRWLSSEATVRAWSEILQKNDAMCVVLLRLIKTKNFNMLLSLCQHCHLTWQN